MFKIAIHVLSQNTLLITNVAKTEKIIFQKTKKAGKARDQKKCIPKKVLITSPSLSRRERFKKPR